MCVCVCVCVCEVCVCMDVCMRWVCIGFVGVCIVYACTTTGTPHNRKSDVHSHRRVMLTLEVTQAIQSGSRLFSIG